MLTLLLLAMQVPAPTSFALAAPDKDLSLSILESDAPAPRVRLVNDGKARVRVLQPYWAEAGGLKGCVLWAEGDKPHPLTEPTDSGKDFLIFRDADFILAPGQSVDLSARCEANGPAHPRLTHVLLVRTGSEQLYWLVSRPPTAIAKTP
jgi:hypothetical protein